MATATFTILLELQPVWGGFLVFCRCVITFLTLSALQNNIVSRHIVNPWRSAVGYLYLLTNNYRFTFLNYSTMEETVPAPTVLPPSLIANLNPFSIAIGLINSISISILSPGITISTPSGRFATPVMSVVLK